MPFTRSKPRALLGETELLDYAAKSLGAKMKSERDLRRRLLDRTEPGADGREAVDRVISKLKELRYLSDERFAADYTRLRQENDKFGRRRVQQGLMQKGIATPVASEALARQYDEVDEAALAREYVARKRLQPPAGDREQREKQTARLMRRLMAAGFSSRAIWAVLRAWGSAVHEDEIADAADSDFPAGEAAASLEANGTAEPEDA